VKPETEAKFGLVRKPASTSKVLGADVRGFSHSISSDAVRHMVRRHPDLTAADFAKLPEIVRATPTLGQQSGPNGEPRLLYRATVGGVKYGYVGEYRRRKRRLAAVTLYIE
jgi:hypothetical protein